MRTAFFSIKDQVVNKVGFVGHIHSYHMLPSSSSSTYFLFSSFPSSSPLPPPLSSSILFLQL